MEKDTNRDPVNGRFNGWVYAQSLTSRDYNRKMALAYLKLSPESMAFYKNHTDAVPLEHYKPNRMYFSCNDMMHVANSIKYMKCVESKIRFHKKARLIETVLTYTVQTAKNDPKLCIIVEFQEPHLRSLSADFICALNEGDLTALQQSISNANYIAVEKSGMRDEVPMAFSDSEKFNVRIIEEKTVLNFPMIFTENGITEWKAIKKAQKVMFFLKDVMPDKAADACGMWYINVVIPKAMQIEDSNCCFSWKK